MKNYDRITNLKGFIVFEHKEGMQGIVVERDKKKWCVFKRSTSTNKQLKCFKSKPQGIKYANKWMEKYPKFED